jgi:hypothetical protein
LLLTREYLLDLFLASSHSASLTTLVICGLSALA